MPIYPAPNGLFSQGPVLRRRHDQGEVMSYYTPTLPSRASRRIPLKGNSSFRGALVMSLGANRSVTFESRLEMMTAYMLLQRDDIADLYDQSTAIEYLDTDGKQRSHTPDFMAVTKDGRRILVAVKRSDSAQRRNFRRTLGLIKAQMGRVADDLVLVTEKSFSAEEASNAELFHQIGREIDDEADAVLIALIDSLNSGCTIAQLVDASGLGARAYRSIIRLLAQNRCRHTAKSRLSYSSIISAKTGRGHLA